MRGYDCYFVAVVEGKVGIDKDEKVGDGHGERESGREKGPGVWICVEDYGQEGRRGF